MLKIKIPQIGFTLVELLVSLGILGLIATLTLPQLYISQDKMKKKAAFKEAFNALSVATQAASMDGVAVTLDIIPYLNATKVCMDSMIAEGCSPRTVHFTGDPDTSENTERGVVLSTGVRSIGGFSDFMHTHKNGYPDAIPARLGLDIDGLYIGLEAFPKPEYFYVFISVAEQPFDFVNAPPNPLSNYDWAKDYLQANRPGTSYVLRPGEVKCFSSNCNDMFN
ncbi:MAG: type II secretion system protein [Vampirovibrio sp.]